MRRFPSTPPQAGVHVLRAAALATFILITASACFPDGPVEVDTSAVTVQVRDPEDSPVAGAQVTWWPAGLTEDQASAGGTTGASGNVTIDVLTLWEDIRIRVSPPAGFGVPETQANPVGVMLLPGATTITFRVVAQTP